MTSTLRSRAELQLRPPRSVSHNITPLHLTGHYGGPSPWPSRNPADWGHARCAVIWRAWQAYHMDHNGWVDIAYTSGVCPHGERFEGRGSGVRTAAMGTNDGNQTSYATCYIAGDDDPLTDAAKAAFLDEMSALAVPLDRVHSDWHSTSCAGPNVNPWVHNGHPAPGSSAPQPPAPGHPYPGILREGSRGEPVRQLQRALNDPAKVGGNGYGLVVDGDFGHRTHDDVRDYQHRHGLAVDGIVGPQTWAALAP